MITHSVRFRLTLLFVLLFGGAQAALWGIVDQIRTQNVLTEFDRRLRARADDIRQAILESGATTESAAAGSLAKVLQPFSSDGFYFQVRRSDGRTVLRSINLGVQDLPFGRPHEVDLPEGQLHALRTVEGSWGAGPIQDDDQLRLSTTRLRTRDGDMLILQTAVDLQLVMSGILASRRLLIVCGIVSVILGSLTTWYVTSKSLTPLKNLAETARRVGAGQLGARSDLRNTDNEVTQVIAAVNDMLTRLEREFHALERFVANISHELKTPLAVLLGEARRLRRAVERDADDNPIDFVETVEVESRKMLRTIEAFLILARAKAQDRLPVTTRVSLEDVVFSAVESCRPLAFSQNVRMIPRFDDTDESAEPFVAGDVDLLRSMLENLLQNAIRHTPENSSIHVTVKNRGDSVELSVRDQGPGIPEDQMSTIFDRFHQYHAAGKRLGAAGLGLAIVKAVVDLHGGSIDVRNCSSGGCEFKVVFETADRPAPDKRKFRNL